MARLSNLECKFGLNQWMVYQKRERMPQFQAFAEKVKKRDFNTCRFCGFTAEEDMVVVNLDHNYSNNIASNLATACPLCAQCLFIEQIGCGDNNGGVLIFLPEMSQAELNGLTHALFCAIANGTMHESSAQTIYNNLRLRAKSVENVYGEGRSEPKVFGKMVINTPSSNASALHKEILKDIRVLANISSFSDQIKTWSKQAAGNLNTSVQQS